MSGPSFTPILLAALALPVLGQGAAAQESLPDAPYPESEAQTHDYNGLRNAYFGDLHVHTKYSFDAFMFAVRATPADAYRYARGEAIRHPAGYDVRLSDPPLDFMAVTDHAVYLGSLAAMEDPGSTIYQHELSDTLITTDRARIAAAWRSFRTLMPQYRELSDPSVVKWAWGDIIATAEEFYEPGRLTTFIGYEYSLGPEGRHHHRNVIFAGSDVPPAPFSILDSDNPEDLWAWLDGLRADGIESLAIPHNMNQSDGTVFVGTDWAGAPITADYAETRMRNEPLVEITQVKGTSETHPALSPNDEWAGFEIVDYTLMNGQPVSVFKGGYARDGLNTGLEFQAREGFNPFRFGFIGSSDTHNGAGPYEEDNYFSKVGLRDSRPSYRGSVPPGGAQDWDVTLLPDTVRMASWGASGLAGVWAEENTREAIYAALRRKETFATSGPRIRLRLFAGGALPETLAGEAWPIEMAYETGVPMGGSLSLTEGESPHLFVWAVRDPRSGWLQRAQIVKGWVVDGEAREQVYDVACSDGLTPDPETHRCPDNGATVNMETCEVSRDVGATELKTVWTDPDFDPVTPAYYYLRVLENPSCRWSTWDAIRAGTPPTPNRPATIQERAWSSPIWYAPS